MNKKKIIKKAFLNLQFLKNEQFFFIYLRLCLND